MRRRDVLTGLVGLGASSSLQVRAQQPAMKVVGFLLGASADGSYVDSLVSVRQGLRETGFVDGQNILVESRSAENRYERLPALAADLVQRRVAVIFVTGSIVSALVAKAATSSIPVVFAMGSDPVRYGLVASLGRPGGNVTGVTFYNSDLGPKRLELLRELLPTAVRVGMLVNPNNPNFESDTKGVEAAAALIGIEVVVAHVGTERDVETAFAELAQRRVDALYVNNDALFQARQRQIIAFAMQHALPSIFTGRPQAVSGGLMSYGASTIDMYRRAGIYVGRVLNGAKPADLPVLQPTNFDLVINLKTAKALGLVVPPQLLARADEVIE